MLNCCILVCTRVSHYYRNCNVNCTSISIHNSPISKQKKSFCFLTERRWSRCNIIFVFSTNFPPANIQNGGGLVYEFIYVLSWAFITFCVYFQLLRWQSRKTNWIYEIKFYWKRSSRWFRPLYFYHVFRS